MNVLVRLGLVGPSGCCSIVGVNLCVVRLVPMST